MFWTVRITKKTKRTAAAVGAVLLSLLLLCLGAFPGRAREAPPAQEFIRWVDFTVPLALLQDAADLDCATHGGSAPIDWVDAIAYLGARYYGDFSQYRRADLDELARQVASGTSVADLGAGKKLFAYYREAYGAVLSGLLGEYTQNGETRYGLRGFFPVAQGFDCSHYDDFGAGRSYGYARKHLGHDLMAAVGTPVIAVESGTVEALGWNPYGGWRVGIRSFDGKRYHYYAHLRKDRPYAQGLQVGDTVAAGQVIGYVGRTGYSTTENVNNIEIPHLHYGLQLIFDESQKEAVSEIWIDVYALCRLLAENRSAVRRDDATGEWTALSPLEDPPPADRFLPPAPAD